MKVLSIFAASIFAAGLAFSSAALAAEDSGYQGGSGMSSQGATSGSMESQSMGATGSQSQSQQGSMASTSDPQQIRQVQQALKEQGYKVGPVDGIMGPKTSSALRNFQRDQGVQTSGQIDQQTLQALGVSRAGETQEQFGVSPEFGGEQQEQQSDQLEQDQSGAMGESGSDIQGSEPRSGSGMESDSEATESPSGGSSGGMSR